MIPKEMLNKAKEIAKQLNYENAVFSFDNGEDKYFSLYNCRKGHIGVASYVKFTPGGIEVITDPFEIGKILSLRYRLSAGGN